MVFGSTEGLEQTAEVEFFARHPDIFSTNVTAVFINELAKSAYEQGGDNLAKKSASLENFRGDIGVYSTPGKSSNGITPVRLSIGGHIKVPDSVPVSEIANRVVRDALSNAGYLRDGSFSSDNLEVDLQGIVKQSSDLNGVTNENLFSDACRVVGHYIQEPYGLNGTFPSLIIAQEVDCAVGSIIRNDIPELRPDGKVHVTTFNRNGGFKVSEVSLSVAHKKGFSTEKFRGYIQDRIRQELSNYNTSDLVIEVNDSNKPFDVHFLQADHGISKAKDGVVVHGGLANLGTDGVWGKCAYKSSSNLLPYAFAVSQVVAQFIGADYVSISARSKHGKPESILKVDSIDPKYEHERESINRALEGLPKDRDGIREVLGMGVNLETYATFNDVAGFHNTNKPWKQLNNEIVDKFKAQYVINKRK
jgi:hypothetical protein